MKRDERERFSIFLDFCKCHLVGKQSGVELGKKRVPKIEGGE